MPSSSARTEGRSRCAARSTPPGPTACGCPWPTGALGSPLPRRAGSSRTSCRSTHPRPGPSVVWGLGLGYKVTLGPGGSAIVRLASGRTFELMGGGVLITGKDRLQLAGGSALGTLTAPGELDTGGLTVTSRGGTFRVEAGASPRVG